MKDAKNSRDANQNSVMLLPLKNGNFQKLASKMLFSHLAIRNFVTFFVYFWDYSSLKNMGVNRILFI